MEFLLLALLLASLGGNYWLITRVLRPVRRLSERTQRMAQGDLKALEQNCGGIAEVHALRHSLASMAGHVQRAQTEGLAYRSALTDGQEAERARIAHELHDDTVQSLIAIAQGIDMASRWIETEPDRARSILSQARTQTVESVEGLRRLIADLRPPALAELGISAALRMLTEQTTSPPLEVRVSGVERRIDAARELALFRVAQEAVRNAHRHGSPSRITLDLTFRPRAVTLTVSDDGIGFGLPQPLDRLAEDAHYGLIGMRERVQSLNGQLSISSQPGKGTIIAVTLPLADTDQPSESVRDPVCGALIQPQQAYGSAVHEGERYYFCCPVCQGAFLKEPARYLTDSLDWADRAD